jgi:hypothetical protein
VRRDLLGFEVSDFFGFFSDLDLDWKFLVGFDMVVEVG